jgi:hypothetical protein
MAAQAGVEACAPSGTTADGPPISSDRIKPFVEGDDRERPSRREKNLIQQFIQNLLAGMAVWHV